MTDGTGDWVLEPREVPEALTEDFQAEPYRDPWADTIAQRLDTAMRERLDAFFHMGSGIGDVRDD
jgi:hypothetical protein